MLIKYTKIPTTENPCGKCFFSFKSKECERRQNECRIFECGIRYYFVLNVANFKSLDSAPRNAKRFVGLFSDGKINTNIHYACNFSGEIQPPFEGFFYKSRKEAVGLIGWKPFKPVNKVPKFGKNWWNRKGPRNSPNLSIERLMKITGLKPNEENKAERR